jgi:molybdate transport system ATP-binding protein
MSLQINLDTKIGSFSLALNTKLPSTGLSAVFGPSGCGKTTLLKCIAGLNHAEGHVMLNDTCWQNSAGQLYLSAHERRLAYIFQDARLLPHLSVLENIKLNRVFRGLPEKGKALDKAIDEFELEQLLNHKPAQLSGGQRQRVGLARAIASEPDLIMMDEPLSALDETSKSEVMTHLKRFKRNTETPILYVSHSIEEVAQLADHMLIMSNGRLVTSGQVYDVISAHPELFSESQLSSIIAARVVEIDQKHHLVRAEINAENDQPISVWLNAGDVALGSEVRLRIAARDISLSLINNMQQSIMNSLPVTVAKVNDTRSPGIMSISLQLGSQTIHTQITQKSFSNLGLTVGSGLWAQVKALSVFE